MADFQTWDPSRNRAASDCPITKPAKDKKSARIAEQQFLPIEKSRDSPSPVDQVAGQVKPLNGRCKVTREAKTLTLSPSPGRRGERSSLTQAPVFYKNRFSIVKKASTAPKPFPMA